MIRRKLTLKRVDPWSVLKFGFVVNVALLLVGLLAFWIVWVAIRRLGLIEQFCGSVGTIVLDLQECSVNGGNIFRTVLFLGVLGVVVQTGIAVFGAFLYNLIADLTGGLAFSFLDESGDAVLTSSKKAARSDEAAPRPAAGSSTGGGSSGGGAAGSAGAAAAGAGAASAGGTGAGPTHDTGSFRPTGPPRTPDSSRPTSSPGTPPPRSATEPGDGAPSSTTDSDPSRTRSRSDEDDEDDRDTGRRPASPGSSLWGDPTRSRE